MSNDKAPLRCVLFDLDGTLLDTAPDLGAAVNHVLVSEGFAPLSDAIIRQTTSHGALGLLKAGLGDELLEELGTTRLRTALLDYYAANLCVGTRPYEGMVDLIEWLDDKKLPWGIVTNKPEYLARLILPQLGWEQRCAVLIGGDTLAERKPHPLPLQVAAQQIKTAASACVYVGDDERDIIAARAAGMPSVAALWGYRLDTDDPQSWQADCQYEQPQQLWQPAAWPATQPASA